MLDMLIHPRIRSQFPQMELGGPHECAPVQSGECDGEDIEAVIFSSSIRQFSAMIV